MSVVFYFPREHNMLIFAKDTFEYIYIYLCEEACTYVDVIEPSKPHVLTNNTNNVCISNLLIPVVTYNWVPCL